jgi:G patch domain and KOW motifs-containing protein
MDLKKPTVKRKTFALEEKEEIIEAKKVHVIKMLEKQVLPNFNGLDDREKYHKDLESRPAESEEQYGRVPIEQFGAALLKGMGWKEGTAVGKNPDGLLKPIELTKRPALLGLGATPNPLEPPPKARKILPGDKIIVSKAPEVAIALPDPRKKISQDRFNKGDMVKIIEGRNAGERGKVIETSIKKDGIAVKVQLKDKDDVYIGLI